MRDEQGNKRHKSTAIFPINILYKVYCYIKSRYESIKQLWREFIDDLMDKEEYK